MNAKSDIEPEVRVVGQAKRCCESETSGDRYVRDVVCGDFVEFGVRFDVRHKKDDPNYVHHWQY